MVGGGPEAVEEGIEPSSDEGDLNEGFGFPRVSGGVKGKFESLKRGRHIIHAYVQERRKRPTFCCVCAGR
jgi:hypothetical protein